MGDYTKLIVNADVRGVAASEIREKIAELGPSSSAYHCGQVVIAVEEDSFSKGTFGVTLVCQTKYGVGQEEFLKWLEPFVVDGSGVEEIWAFQIYEWGRPKIWAKRPMTDKEIEDSY